MIQELFNLNNFMKLVNGNMIHFPHFNLMGRFKRIITHADMATTACLRSKAARLV